MLFCIVAYGMSLVQQLPVFISVFDIVCYADHAIVLLG